MPEWAGQLFSQFPIFGVLCAAVAVAARYLTRVNGEYLDRLERANRDNRQALDQAVARYDVAVGQNNIRHEAELDRLQQQHDAHLRSLRAEIRRLERQLERLIERLGGGS